MYILVQHTVSDPIAVWPRAQQLVPTIPASLKLHHSFPSPDGRKAVCIWEAASIESLKTFLEPMMGPESHNQVHRGREQGRDCPPNRGHQGRSLGVRGFIKGVSDVQVFDQRSRRSRTLNRVVRSVRRGATGTAETRPGNVAADLHGRHVDL